MLTEPTAVVPCAEAPDVADDVRRALFRCVLVHRLVEERTMALYRQGRIPGSVYTGRGQEAVGAGAGLALGPDDVCAPLNRELSCHLARGVTVAHVFRNYLGARDRPDAGPRRQHALRRARAGRVPARLDARRPGAASPSARRWRSSAAAQPRVALTFFGDGAFNCGDTHEGLNLAGALDVPAVFVAQSNRVAYSTFGEKAMRNPNLAERIEGGWTRSRARASTAPTRSPCTGCVRRRGRARPRRRGPTGGRGAHAAHRRPRRARRRPLHGSGADRRSTARSATRSSDWRRG